jgi:excisionase family DNA binding protein
MSEQIATLSLKDAAKSLNVSERFIAKLIADRRLPSLKLGRRRLIRQEALRQYLERIETIIR